jgi:hypothetical protein
MLKKLLHRAVAAFQRARRVFWFFTRPTTYGVHAIPVTPAGNLVLVSLSYARGWRLPAAGASRTRTPRLRSCENFARKLA